MNPEFLRNVWLELTPRRMTIMAVLLILAFLASEGSPGLMSAGSIAQNLFYLIVVLWGTRNAALSVVGEIRDRTWDSQRLSSIGPGAMTVGKLFGGTIYNWFGGAICLIMVLVQSASANGIGQGVMECIRLIGMGALAQAAALLASLIAIRRRQSAHSRLDIFIYQIVGLVAAGVFQLVWGEAATPHINAHTGVLNTISWWGADYSGTWFSLVSLAIFAAWTFLGCYRQMRTELQMNNGPLVWLGFSLFLALYVAGFASLGAKLDADLATIRVALAASALGILTYVSVLLEPKDRVLYRWMRAQLGAGRIGPALWRIQTWMTGYVLFVIASLFLLLLVIGHHGNLVPAMVLASVGFLTRDIGIVMFFAAGGARRRGDWAAIFTLFALYLLIPAILGHVSGDVAALFRPNFDRTSWLSAASAWAQVVGVWCFALYRFLRDEERAQATSAGSAAVV